MKLITAIIMLMIGSLIFAQYLDEKKKQLEQLNQKIKQEQKSIEEAKNKKNSTEKNITSTQKKKKLTDKKIKKLISSESKAKSQLNEIIHVIDDQYSELDLLNYFCGKELTQLAITHYQSELFPEKKIDSRLIANLIKRTAEEIILAEDKLGILEIEKNRTNKKYENVIFSKIAEKEKSRKYLNRISTLNKEVSQYEKNLIEAEERRRRLKSEAADLDDLITKLQSEILNEDFSYKFSTPKLIWPIKGKIIRDYGEQKSSEYKVSINNNGIDISAEVGNDIVAVESGVIAYARWYIGAGKLVIIDHQNGFHTLYSHNSKILVAKGDTVKKNQLIALSGKTGSTEEACLHFELRKDGKPVNPIKYLE